MISRLFSRLVAAAVLSACVQVCPAQRSPAITVRAVSHFHFTVAAPFDHVAPQFGPEAELAWGDPDWKPQFVYPLPGRDIASAVFTVPHGQSSSIWVNTIYDPAGGRMQYVYVLPGAMVGVIDVEVRSADATHTAVFVTYTRTALTPEHNEAVTRLAEEDAGSGAEWQHFVEHALRIGGR